MVGCTLNNLIDNPSVCSYLTTKREKRKENKKQKQKITKMQGSRFSCWSRFHLTILNLKKVTSNSGLPERQSKCIRILVTFCKKDLTGMGNGLSHYCDKNFLSIL